MDACFAGAEIGSEIAALTVDFCTAEMLKVRKFVTRIVDKKETRILSGCWLGRNWMVVGGGAWDANLVFERFPSPNDVACLSAHARTR